MFKINYVLWCSIVGENTNHSRNKLGFVYLWEKNKIPKIMYSWIGEVMYELRKDGVNPVIKNCGVIK